MMCLSNYSIMSDSTTIHWSTQLFEFDCVSCIFLDTIGAGVERKTYPDAATDDGREDKYRQNILYDLPQS